MRSIYFAHFSPGGRLRPQDAQSLQTKHKINEQITAKEVRVLNEDNVMIGIMSIRQALSSAEEQELDLVEIAPQASPPVVKIIDYGKFLYEIQKREKHARKQQQQQQMKEIRFKWRTATHDFNFKTKHAREFLIEGNKVKASVMFRGREITHQEVGQELLERFVAALDDVGKVDSQIKMEGKSLSVVMAPDKAKKKPGTKQTEE